jgi:hypothetical protein
MKHPEPVDRARFLMSPYNLKEAHRVKELRHTVIGVGVAIAIALIAGGVYAWLLRG